MRRSATECLGAPRRCPRYAKENIFASIAQFKGKERGLISHARQAEGRVRVHGLRGADLKAGAQEMRRITEWGATQSRRGPFSLLQVVRRVARPWGPNRAATCHVWGRTVATHRSGSARTSYEEATIRVSRTPYSRRVRNSFASTICVPEATGARDSGPTFRILAEVCRAAGAQGPCTRKPHAAKQIVFIHYLHTQIRWPTHRCIVDGHRVIPWSRPL